MAEELEWVVGPYDEEEGPFDEDVEVDFEIDSRILSQQGKVRETVEYLDTGLGPIASSSDNVVIGPGLNSELASLGIAEPEYQGEQNQAANPTLVPVILTSFSEPLGQPRIMPDGTTMVDVELLVEDIAGVDTFEVRVTPVA